MTLRLPLLNMNGPISNYFKLFKVKFKALKVTDDQHYDINYQLGK